MIHELKTWPEPFEAIASGAKPYEVRKHDRPFAVGDMLWLREWDPDLQGYIGPSLHRRVTCITKPGAWGLPADICVLGLAPMSAEEVEREWRGQISRSKEELEEMVAAMHAASERFYGAAIHIGNHAFIEFTGLMNEYIKLCAEAILQGIDFTECSRHTGQALPMANHHAAYLAEKLACIYGESLTGELREAFLTAFVGKAPR